MLTMRPGARDDANTSFPLTPLQAGMLFHALRDPGTDVDIEQVVFTLAGPLDADRLRDAWQRACERYDVLRASFRWDGERPLHDVAPHVLVPFVVDHRACVAPEDRERILAATVADERRAGFSLDTAPLQRVRLVRFGATDHALIWTNHHAILDGRARAIVLRDIVDAYAGRPLGPLPAPFADYVAWLDARDVAATAPFWRTYLSGIIEPTPLPPSADDPAPRSDAATVVATRTIDAAATRVLSAFARAHDLTLNVLLQAAWALLLSRTATSPEVVFGVVRACRHAGVDGAAGIVGPVINTLPMCVAVDETSPLIGWLAHVRSQWQALRAVERTPLQAIAGWSAIPAPTPLFDSLVVYEREPLERLVRTTIDPHDTLGIRRVQSFHHTGRALTLLAAGSDELELSLQADATRYTADDAERLLDQVVTIVNAFATTAGGRVRDVSMLGAGARRTVLDGFQRTSVYPREATVHALFAERAARTPDAVAAQLGEATMTYGELAAASATVAAHLHDRGIGPGDYVGLCVERSFAMLAALLGILAAGAASIALDPANPAERTAFMLGEAGVTAILAQSHLIDGLDDALALPAAFGAHALDLDALLATPMPPAALPIVVATDPAHVMYTSGSTGSPKGAVLPHRAIVRTVRGADYLHFGSDETFFAFVPLTFDVAILELWGPLLNGARLVLAPPGLPSLDVLAATIERGGVTTLWLTTALFEHMVDEQLPRLRGLRQLIVGGDVMSPAHARRALAALPGIRLLNVYGPTEATVLITAQPLTAPPVRPIPLGAPIANARVYVLDAMRNPVPIGVPGEIYTGGDGVARGYLNQPARTAEVFVTDPFDGRDGATMYRTGDLARWRADGTLDFLGRVDHQVKIRGIRVELGEIEAALTDHPDVREAVVIAAAAPDGEKQLIAYVVARIAAAPPDAGALLAYLTRRLPSQCIPAFIVMLDALPVTPTGKFDRKALPAPHPSVSAVRARRPAHTAAEIAVAAHMAEVLNLDDIGCDDDFYAFGGDSLRAMRLIARLRATFQVDLSIRDLLAAPRVGDLTAAIVALGRTTDGSARSNLTALRTSGASTPLFFLHGDLAGGGRYCDELARQLGEDRPVYVIAPHGVPAGTMPPSVKTMARDNVAAIRAIAPNGPVLLGGFCNGGVVAYEIATQLVRAGVAVEGVVLVDAVNVNPQPIPLHVRARRAVRRALDRFRPEPPATSWDAWHDRWLDRWLRVLADYVPGPFRGPVALVWTDEFAPDAERFTAAWRRIAPAGSTGTMPGSHLTSLTRHLTTTARVLAEHIDRRPVQGDERVAHEDDLHARLPLPA